MAIIAEARTANPLLRLGIWISERTTGRRMEPARLLAWYPKAALGAGVLESLVAHREPSKRLLKLVRVTASMTASCPFCLDMNSYEAEEAGVTQDELRLLQQGQEAEATTFTQRERVAIAYTRAISSTRSPRSSGRGRWKSGDNNTRRPWSRESRAMSAVSGPATSTASPVIGRPEISPPITRTSLPNRTAAPAPRADSSSEEAAVSTVQRDTPKRWT